LLQVGKLRPRFQGNIFIIKKFGIFTRQLQIRIFRKDISQNARVCPEFHFRWYKRHDRCEGLGIGITLGKLNPFFSVALQARSHRTDA